MSREYPKFNLPIPWPPEPGPSVPPEPEPGPLEPEPSEAQPPSDLYNYLGNGEPEEGEPEEEEWEESRPDEGSRERGDGAFFGGHGRDAVQECLDYVTLVAKLKDLDEKITKKQVNKAQLKEVWKDLYLEVFAKCQEGKKSGKGNDYFWCQVLSLMNASGIEKDGSGTDIMNAFRQLHNSVKDKKPPLCS